jgi:outer membrane protein assembly factor BamB
MHNGSDLSGTPPLLRKARTFVNLFRYDYDWRQRLGMKAWGSPAVSPDGKHVYVVSRGKGVQSLDSQTGTLVWAYDLGQPWNYLAGVALSPGGTVYGVSQRRYVHAVRADGVRLWRTDTGVDEDFWGNPCVDVDAGAVYVTTGRGGDNGRVIALALDSGAQLWACRLPASTRGAVALSHGSLLAVACMDGHLVLIDREDGAIKCQTRLVDAPYPTVWTTPSIDPGNRVLVPLVVSGSSGAVACLDLQGKELWRLPMGKSHATPIVDAGRRLFAGSWTGEMLCYQT